MKIAFFIYEDMTTLDFIGVYDPVTRLKTMGFIQDLEYEVCALENRVVSVEGLTIIPDHWANDLSVYDYIVIPGGSGVSKLIQNPAFVDWFKTIATNATIASVCGGSLLLGWLGLLRNRKATTHPQLMTYLQPLTGAISERRIVDEGVIITARGVTAAIDLGLYLCEKLAGKDVRKKIAEQMDYLGYDNFIVEFPS
ncbi:MAG TPA: DJ-1/PfpI family protein [Syntrophomonadaceae bacterium]|nr:DJ-1/PfpI family protein [Syntrophomonadaceae bacterium]